MASKKDVVRITDDDYKQKSFKTAPSGTYKYMQVNKAQSKIVPGNESNVLRLVTTIQKGPHKGVNVFDNIAAHVGWKIAQVLLALGYTKERIKKLAKANKLTLQEVLKIAAGKDIGAVIRETNSEEYGKQNKVVQYLPFGGAADEEEEEEEEDEEEEKDEDDVEEDDEDEEDEENEDEDLDEDDEDEDEDAEDEEDEDEEEDEEDEDEDEEEDDDEEEDEDEDEEDEPPARRKPVAKKAATKKTATKKRR